MHISCNAFLIRSFSDHAANCFFFRQSQGFENQSHAQWNFAHGQVCAEFELKDSNPILFTSHQAKRAPHYLSRSIIIELF